MSDDLIRRLVEYRSREPHDSTFVMRLLETTREIERNFEGEQRSRLLQMAEETFERHLEQRDHSARARASLDRLRADQDRLLRILEGLRAMPADETLH